MDIYRLMRIAEETFDETPGYIDINTMFDTGIKYDNIPDNLLKGGEGEASAYSEGIYSMYLLNLSDINQILDFI